MISNLNEEINIFIIFYSLIITASSKSIPKCRYNVSWNRIDINLTFFSCWKQKHFRIYSPLQIHRTQDISNFTHPEGIVVLTERLPSTLASPDHRWEFCCRRTVLEIVLSTAPRLPGICGCHFLHRFFKRNSSCLASLKSYRKISCC